MAIVDMKRILLVGEKPQRDNLLLRLQQMGCVEVTPFEEELLAASQQDGMDAVQLEQRLQRVRWAINRLGKYDTKKTGMLTPRPEATLAQLLPDEEETMRLEALIDGLEALERRSGDLKAKASRLTNRMEQLQPWHGFDLPPSQVQDSPSHKQYMGTISSLAVPQLLSAWAGEPIYLEEVGQDRDQSQVWAIAHQSRAGAFQDALKEAGFVPAQLGQFEGSVAEETAQIGRELAALESDREALEQHHRELAPQLPALRVYHDALLGAERRAQAAEQLVQTQHAFLLRGWVPARLADRVTADLQREFPRTQVEIADPLEGDEPPVLLHNARPVAPFEAVVQGYALPAYGSVDPTPVMAPFFACFFGMMVSDAGYGVMMALLVPLLARTMRPTRAGKKLFDIIAIGGVFTVFWGIMYNTWFGFAPQPAAPFDPIYRPLEVMMLCVAVGALHLLAGLGLAAWQNIKQGQYMDVLYDQISWLLILVGLALLAVPGMGTIGQWVAIVGVVLILLFAGRSKTKNPFKRVLSGLGALYGISSWLSDLLSYLRLFGMGLATGVIGMVFNILIGMVFAMGPIGWVLGAVLFVGCHLFNAGINILGAYVHASRLQYIEFFGKFLQEGGRPFMPLEQKPRYVHISDAQA